MNWLARLKKIDIAPERDATETTKRVSVVFVAPGVAPITKTGGDSPAANDPAQDPDRWAWPHNQAMTGAEIDTFTARLNYFTGCGMADSDVEALAYKLVSRDRESDDRRLCLECAHLAGHGAGAMRCTNWERAGVAVQARDARLSGALVHRLQQCDGFKEVGL
jgi:hypothetical protein